MLSSILNIAYINIRGLTNEKWTSLLKLIRPTNLFPPSQTTTLLSPTTTTTSTTLTPNPTTSGQQ